MSEITWKHSEEQPSLLFSARHDNTVRFYAGDDVEIMRFEENGDIYVKGNLVENDREVVDAFREWLRRWLRLS